MRSQRSSRLTTDKFALFPDVWDKFVENCQGNYKPGAHLTVDEQLFPSKTRCRFIVYMPDKPDKFGIKFWCLVDNDSKYLCNAVPYLGKDELRDPNILFAQNLVMSLCKPYLKKRKERDL